MKKNSENYIPHDFFIGHEKCLNIELDSRIQSEGNFEIRKKIEEYYHINSGKNFLQNLNRYEEQFKRHNERLSKERSDSSIPSSREIELNQAVEKIKRINK